MPQDPSKPLKREKHERFAQEYVTDANATQAAIRAGYTERSARQQGSRLLTNADIRARVEHLTEQVHNKLSRTADDVIQRLWDIVDVEDPRMANARVKALDLLGRRFGIYVDRMSVEGWDGLAEAMQTLHRSKVSGE